ncbi:hypothetical protein HYW53_01820 [Candidatus Giovannonibacteria bacterium]|nr:hypothetical protein [Candidatus Giovannonibacteria bacterium]
MANNFYDYGMMQNLWFWSWLGPFIQVLVLVVLVLWTVKLFKEVTKTK